jgi:hypothetical protein
MVGNFPIMKRNFPIMMGKLPIMKGNVPIMKGNVPIMKGKLPTMKGKLPTMMRMSEIKKNGKKTEIFGQKKARSPDLGNEPIALFMRVCAYARARIII